jgi:hypothetical protein
MFFIDYFGGFDVSLVACCQEIRINEDRMDKIFSSKEFSGLPESLKYFNIPGWIFPESVFS